MLKHHRRLSKPKLHFRNLSYRLTPLFIAVVFLLTGFLSLLPTTPAHALAEFPNTPVADFLQANGPVSSILPAADGSTYIGGAFSALGTEFGPSYAVPSGVPLGTSTAVPAYTAVTPNDVVNTSLADGTGGWYIGGSFTQVGGITRNRLAHILPDGTLDSDFDPNINNTVNTLALSSDGQTLYVGGSFNGANSVNGSTTRNRLAAFNTSTSTATSFNPNVGATVVNTLALTPDGSTLYVGGAFTTVNGATTRNRLAAFNTSTSTATSFNPNVSNTIHSLALTSDGSTLYAAGRFNGANSVNGSTTRNRLAAFSTSTGIATSFDPNVGSLGSDAVSTLVFNSDNSTLYAGGSFTIVNGSTTRKNLAAFDPSTAVATSFNPNVDGSVSALALTSDNTTLYAGGNFLGVNSFGSESSTPRNRLAAFSTSTGIATSFDPSMNSQVSALALTSDDSTLYAGGSFTELGGALLDGIPRQRLARVLSDGTVDPDFDPNLGTNTTSTRVSALALSPDGTTLYVGGRFVTAGGSVVGQRLIALNASTGVATGFNPNITGGTQAEVYSLALSPDGATLYVGGDFGLINGSINRSRLAAFDTDTGDLTSFNPGAVGGTGVKSITLSPDGQTLYVGGSFTTVSGGTPRNRLAAINTFTGVATSFDPNLNAEVRSIALSPDGQTLYANGDFTTVNGSTIRNKLASFSTSTGTATNFDPNVTGGGSSLAVFALALSPDNQTLYAAGQFTTVNGSLTRNRLAAFNTSTGTATSFNPNMGGGGVSTASFALAFSHDGSTLYTGGDFTSVNAQSRNRLAAFHNPDLDNDGISNQEESNSPNGGDANNDGTPDMAQAHVASLLDPTTNQYAVLAVSEACSITSLALNPEATNQTPDPAYSYPLGLMDFTLNCGTPGFTANITQYYYHAPENQSYTVRKYNPTTHTYRTIQNASIANQTIGSQPVVVAAYQVTDNGPLDLDPTDGIIRDPAGLGTTSNQPGSLASTGRSLLPFALLSLLSISITGGLLVLRKRVG